MIVTETCLSSRENAKKSHTRQQLQQQDRDYQKDKRSAGLGKEWRKGVGGCTSWCSHCGKQEGGPSKTIIGSMTIRADCLCLCAPRSRAAVQTDLCATPVLQHYSPNKDVETTYVPCQVTTQEAVLRKLCLLKPLRKLRNSVLVNN